MKFLALPGQIEVILQEQLAATQTTIEVITQILVFNVICQNFYFMCFRNCCWGDFTAAKSDIRETL